MRFLLVADASIACHKNNHRICERYKDLQLDWRVAPILQSALTDFELDPGPMSALGQEQTLQDIGANFPLPPESRHLAQTNVG